VLNVQRERQAGKTHLCVVMAGETHPCVVMAGKTHPCVMAGETHLCVVMAVDAQVQLSVAHAIAVPVTLAFHRTIRSHKTEVTAAHVRLCTRAVHTTLRAHRLTYARPATSSAHCTL